MIYVAELIKKYQGDGYPFTVPVIAALERLRFTAPVTILCGDNGSGKSTLLSILAEKLDAARIGQGIIEREKIIAECQDAFTLARRGAKRCFFFSAEDFIAYIGWVSRAKEEARREIARIDAEETAGDKNYLKMPHAHTLADLDSLYAGDLALCSHGEGFLDFFRSRLRPNGVYLLDEPEGALSYENQYALCLMILDAVKDGCQFLLATHSPVLSAIPGAEILEITDEGFRKTEYDRLESKLFGLCRGTPLSALVETRLGISFPSRAFEEGGIQDAIAYYEDGVFYDILAEELARRDLEEAGETGDPAALNERMDRYIEEFNENGVDRIQIEGMEE